MSLAETLNPRQRGVFRKEFRGWEPGPGYAAGAEMKQVTAWPLSLRVMAVTVSL